MIWFTVILCINLVISYLNARACGQQWDSASGTWNRIVLWSGAVQSAIGFTMAYFILFMFACQATDHWPPAMYRYSVDILTVAIIIPCLGTGLVLTLESFRALRQNFTVGNGVGAAWNTYAQVNNTVELGSAAWDAIGDLMKPKSGDDSSGVALRMAFLLAAASLCSGALTTYTLIAHFRRIARRAEAVILYRR